MKNLLAFALFSVIAFCVGLMKTEPKIKIDYQAVIRKGEITILTNKRKLLLNKTDYLVEKNTMAIDSLKNN